MRAPDPSIGLPNEVSRSEMIAMGAPDPVVRSRTYLVAKIQRGATNFAGAGVGIPIDRNGDVEVHQTFPVHRLIRVILMKDIKYVFPLRFA
jgi:hypothetical protein